MKTAIRNLLRYKGFTIINISSLTIGIMGCMVIGLFVWDEWQFDKNIPGGENIYRIYEQRKNNDVITYGAPVAPAYAGFLKQTYAEVDTTLRILMSIDKFLMEVGENRNYEDKGLFVESSFFSIFPLRFTSGDPVTALTEPGTVVLTEDLAKRYFNTEDPLNKTIYINKDTFAVKGVLAKLPDHFHLDFNYLMSLPSAGIPRERMERWTWHQFYTYVKLRPGANVQLLQDKFQAHMKKEIFPTLTQAGFTFLPFFQPLKDIHLKSADFIYDKAIRGNEIYVKALTIIALFVLVIACFNFINLATARSFRRAKEIGVRKVIGAEKKQLIIQFIGETIFLSLISMLIAIMATFFIVPMLNQFTAKSIQFNPFTNPLLGLIILGAGLVIGVIAGMYPALVLSGFQPVKVLKNMKLVGSGGGAWLRQGLVVIQFTLSVLLIVSTTIVYRQTKFLNDKDPGFSKDQVVYFQVRGDVEAKLDAFKDELRRSPDIVSMTAGYGLPGDLYAGDGVKTVGPDGEKERPANVFIGDHDYVKTLGLRVIAGRDFSKEMATDVQEGFLINETAVKEWGFGTPENAIGQKITWDEWVPADTSDPVKRGKVIGVVEDFHYKSLHEKITPSVIQVYPQVVFAVAVKLKTGDLQNTLGYITKVWNKFAPGYPIDYKFMDETYGAMYKAEGKLSDLLWIFTVMALTVGCMGLFGLAAFSAEQRTKELGIRKVLGASAFNIVGLLSKNFLVLVVIASLVAFPIAWWAMNDWLKDFPYRVNISWWIFGGAIVAALAIALLTVSFQAIKAAVANPVKSLRME
ncbi:MAG TPA: ABC transporter permease [Chitinophagaceae bacterium]|nr:ABC transporter permease [Chitinophagaceae bacterium]